VFAAHVGPFQPAPDRSLRRCWTFQASFPPRLSPGQTGQADRAGEAGEGGRFRGRVAGGCERCDGPVIHFDNVTKMYPNQSRPALENVNIDVEKGEFVFLVGPSGSGKSTFLRLVLKEERPTDGRIHVAGKDLARLTNWKVPYMRRRIGCVFQDFRLLPNKNVYQNVAFALQVIGKPRRFIRKVVPEVVDLVGLEGKHDRMPDELSGGEQQRVAMARAFVNRPMILLADEPTGNIDPATSIGIMKVLDRINRTGTTVVMATHDAAIVDSMRKRVIELEYGKVVRDQSRGVYGQAY
jgi:cell division transport system ATP-binding protein